MRRYLASLSLATSALLSTASFGQLAVTRTLYDTAPISKDNPVVISIPEAGIEIPLGEVKAFFAQEYPDQAYDNIPEDVRKKTIETLIDHHLMSWDAHREGLFEHPEIQGRREGTLGMLAVEKLVAQETAHLDPKDWDGIKAVELALLAELFEKAKIVVNQESYDILLELADRLDKEALEKQLNEEESETTTEGGHYFEVDPEQLSLILSTYKDYEPITIESYLQAYLSVPFEERGSVREMDTFIRFLKPSYEYPLLMEEAKRRGFFSDPAVLADLDRGTNNYMYVIQLERKSMQEASRELGEMNEETQARLKEYYEKMKELRYFKEDETTGEKTILSYEEATEALQADYWGDRTEELQTEYKAKLREGKTININLPSSL